MLPPMVFAPLHITEREVREGEQVPDNSAHEPVKMKEDKEIEEIDEVQNELLAMMNSLKKSNPA